MTRILLSLPFNIENSVGKPFPPDITHRPLCRFAASCLICFFQMTPPLLTIENLRVQFDYLRAVDDVSLTLRGGDLLGLIGPNGAGKTTLLRAIAGLQPLARGVAKLLGETIEPGAGPVLRQLGFTPDTPPVYEELTVRKFLRFIAMGYDLTESETNER